MTSVECMEESGKKRRWGGKKKAETEEPSTITVTSIARETEMVSVALFADQLFSPGMFDDSHESRHDRATLWSSTQKQVITPKLLHDAGLLRHSCIYIPEFVRDWECTTIDVKNKSANMDLYDLMWREMGPQFEKSPYRRSRHPAIVDIDIFKQSETYLHIRRRVLARFPSLKIGYSIVNLYRNGEDFTDFHRDNFQSGANRQESPVELDKDSGNGTSSLASAGASAEAEARESLEPHNVTIGVSLGGQRNLTFKHLQSEATFRFPQSHGDLFAFTTPVNSVFQHAVLKEPAQRPRISLIFWGHLPHEKLM